MGELWGKNLFPFLTVGKLPHKGGMGGRHVIEERHGGNMVSILMLRKNFHMGGAMVGRHGTAMEVPCHGRAPWGENGFHSNVEEKLPHGSNIHLTKTRLFKSLEIIHTYVVPCTFDKISAQIGNFWQK